ATASAPSSEPTAPAGPVRQPLQGQSAGAAGAVVPSPVARQEARGMSEDFGSVEPLLAEHAELERDLADPAIHADAGRAKRLGRRYAELSRIVAAVDAWRRAADDAEAAAELAESDEAFAAELPELQAAAQAAADELRAVLV